MAILEEPWRDTRASDDTPAGQAQRPGQGAGGLGLGSLELLALLVLAALLGRAWIAGLFSTPRMQTLLTVFISICVQAMPFLILGTVLSAAISAFVPARVFTKVLPRSDVLAV